MNVIREDVRMKTKKPIKRRSFLKGAAATAAGVAAVTTSNFPFFFVRNIALPFYRAPILPATEVVSARRI